MSGPVLVILNLTSGNGHRSEDSETLAKLFRAAGVEARILEARTGSKVLELARHAAQQTPPLIVAAGGDGTVSSVASVIVGTETALGVLPLGTLNHFAKDLNIPLELPEAVQTIAAGHILRADVGEVNAHIFLNNSSLGLYPKIVRHREILRSRLGTGKWPALFWAILTVRRRSPCLNVRLHVKGQDRQYRTPLVFIGNNTYVIEGFNIGRRERLNAGVLGLYLIQRCSRWALLGLGIRALFGRLRQSRDFETQTAETIEIDTRRKHMAVATDGEVRVMETPLRYSIRAGALRVIVPSLSEESS